MSIIDTIVFLIFTGGVVLLGCSFLVKNELQMNLLQLVVAFLVG